MSSVRKSMAMIKVNIIRTAKKDSKKYFLLFLQINREKTLKAIENSFENRGVPEEFILEIKDAVNNIKSFNVFENKINSYNGALILKELGVSVNKQALLEVAEYGNFCNNKNKISNNTLLDTIREDKESYIKLLIAISKYKLYLESEANVQASLKKGIGKESMLLRIEDYKPYLKEYL